MLLAVCLFLAVLCVLALLQGMAYERNAKEVATSLVKDVMERAMHVREDILRRGTLSDISELRTEAETLIRLCGQINNDETSPIERDYLIKFFRISERIDELERCYNQVRPVEDDDKLSG